MEFTTIPTEQTTALTDGLLALLAMGCAMYLVGFSQQDAWKARIWTLAFSLLALAAALGALAHGFLMTYGMYQQIWTALNLALGQTVALFVVGAITDFWGRRVAVRALPLMIVAGLAFFGVTQLIPSNTMSFDPFLIFIVYEAAAMLFALWVYTSLAQRRSLPGAGLMAVGVLLSIVAAAVQATGNLYVRLIWEFNHNGLFHLIQMLALILLLLGLRAAFVQSAEHSTQHTAHSTQNAEHRA